MIIGIYFLLLLAASVEDYRTHRVKQYWVLAVWALGLIKILSVKENRWVTVALTCICFALLVLIYILVRYMAERSNRPFKFGGADVRLIPAMLLVQGWDVALLGVFIGLLSAALYYFLKKRKREELPLVPWMTMGCALAEIIYLFSGKNVL